MEDEKQEKIQSALLKVALGGSIAEVTEEYAEVDGALKLTKRKKTKRDVPPDLKALQLLLAENGCDYTVLTDEELEAERLRLVATLQAQTAENSALGTAEKVKAKTTKKQGEGKKKSVATAKVKKSLGTVKTKNTGAGI